MNLVQRGVRCSAADYLTQKFQTTLSRMNLPGDATPSSGAGNEPALQSIPEERIPPPTPLSAGEAKAFAGQEEWSMRHARWRSIRDISLSYLLFIFVLGINIWWDRLVARWIGRSGVKNSWFHLNDGVLIALATTSVANFIGLVAIVARHLFPEIREKQSDTQG